MRKKIMHFPTKLDGSFWGGGGGGLTNPNRISAIFFLTILLFEPLTFEICFINNTISICLDL